MSWHSYVSLSYFYLFISFFVCRRNFVQMNRPDKINKCLALYAFSRFALASISERTNWASKTQIGLIAGARIHFVAVRWESGSAPTGIAVAAKE